MSSTEAPVRVAVVGVGHLGHRHATRLAESPHFNLIAVSDRDPERTRAVAAELGTEARPELSAALDGVDAVVVATSTEAHHQVAAEALDAGHHVLVEKPLTGAVADAEDLVRRAEAGNRVLHVGHVERFNPAIRDLLGTVAPPMFVESHRLAPLVPRSLDIDVVQDLMVHDIDLALAFIGREPISVTASGVAVLSGRVDIANARLSFEGGVTANLTASRVSLERTRKFRMFLPGTYVSADCAKRTAQVYRLKDERTELLAEMLQSGHPLEMLRFLDHSTVGPDGPDALSEEHRAFADAVRGGEDRGVTGRQTLAVLRVMVAVEEAIRNQAG